MRVAVLAQTSTHIHLSKKLLKMLCFWAFSIPKLMFSCVLFSTKSMQQLSRSRRFQPQCGKYRSKELEMWPETPASFASLVSLHWRSWRQNANILCAKTTLWYACSGLAERFPPISRRRHCYSSSLLSLGFQMLQLAKRYSDPKLWCFLCISVS